MGDVEENKKVAVSVVESLRTQPLALALIVINVLFLALGMWVLHGLASASAERAERQAKVITELLQRCLRAPPGA